LISFVSHELKSVLAPAILNAYSVRDGFLGLVNFKQRKAMDSVTRNLDYLASTVKNFLSLSRIERGEILPLKKEFLVKEELLDGIVQDFLKPAEEKNIQIVNKVDPNVKVNSDPDLLQVVVNNLLGNAVKYGAQNGHIVMRCQLMHEQLEIEIYNTGRPLTDEETGRLFKRFSRLSAPELRRQKGTGLGLFITKEIVTRMGGSIWVEPMHEGNSFIFQVPVK
jgi:signal transduction histidine kinase